MLRFVQRGGRASRAALRARRAPGVLGVAVAAVLVAPVGASAAGPIDHCTDAPPWSCADLTARTGGPTGYYPEPWVRGDGVTSIVSYGDGQISGRIRELTLENGQWKSHDLLSQSTGNPPPGIEPSGYVRGDGISTVIYHNGGTETNPQVFELALQNGHWVYSNLLAQPGTQGAVGPAGFAHLQGYVRGDGVTSVIYVGKDGHIHELALQGGKWTHWDLTLTAGAPTGSGASPTSVVPFVRRDGTTTIVYSSGDGEIRQLRLGTDSVWHHSIVTNQSGHPKAASHEVDAYVRPDGKNAIVYGSTDGHVRS